MNYIIYTDGASSNNQNAELRNGGFGALISINEETFGLYGYVRGATNNQMELLAVKRSLEFIQESSNIKLYTDSNYVITTIFNNGKIKKNIKLIESIKELIINKHLNIEVHKVEGHSGNIMNELADNLARHAIETGITYKVIKMNKNVLS